MIYVTSNNTIHDGQNVYCGSPWNTATLTFNCYFGISFTSLILSLGALTAKQTNNRCVKKS